ncbi:hypothetical protein WJX73_002779 [Symbiochloris irregularis]|uniref:Uncharacterized protein n=1 Tax=Symbiochloris irregularis TaxID=706552 RepID=A0AAW1PC69_9CHLO
MPSNRQRGAVSKWPELSRQQILEILRETGVNVNKAAGPYLRKVFRETLVEIQGIASHWVEIDPSSWPSLQADDDFVSAFDLNLSLGELQAASDALNTTGQGLGAYLDFREETARVHRGAPADYMAAVNRVTGSDSMYTGPSHTADIRPVDAMLLSEVLLANSARLSEGYKQRCKSEWGLEGSPFETARQFRTAAMSVR